MKILTNSLRLVPKQVAMLLGFLLFLVLFVYYPVGMVAVHNIDDSADFSAEAYEVKGGSHSVAMAIALVNRETKKHHWTPSDPFFYPGSMLVRMPAFQRGIIAAISRFTVSLSDQIGRTRGSSQIDPDLLNAVGLLKYSPDVWMFNGQVSILPTASSAKQYGAGVKSLISYNQRLSQGTATFERRADNLMQTLDGMASDIGSSSSALETFISTRSAFSFSAAANIFYYNKGMLVADYLLLRELQHDYEDVLREKQLDNVWAQMLDTMRQGMELGNVLVINAGPNSQFLPNHLAVQGFYITRARTQLREVTNILLK